MTMMTNLEDVALLCLGKEEEHGASLVCCSADKDHSSFRVVQIILQTNTIVQMDITSDKNVYLIFIIYGLLLLPLVSHSFHKIP